MSHAPPPDLSDHVGETIRSMARLSSEHEESANLQQRSVAQITGFLSQPAVIGFLALAIGFWVAVNELGPSVGWRVIDPPPFQWLQGMMTMTSLFMVFLLLGAQKHEDRLNKNGEFLTLELAILSEQKIAKVIQRRARGCDSAHCDFYPIDSEERARMKRSLCRGAATRGITLRARDRDARRPALS
jgi:uncharacterized membrane protein